MFIKTMSGRMNHHVKISHYEKCRKMKVCIAQKSTSRISHISHRRIFPRRTLVRVCVCVHCEKELRIDACPVVMRDGSISHNQPCTSQNTHTMDGNNRQKSEERKREKKN